MNPKVLKTTLLAAVTANRETHREAFEAALSGYRIDATKTLEKMLERLDKGKMVPIRLGMPLPEDHTRDYDRVIRWLEIEVESEIELTEAEFAQYVMDDWAWKRDWSASNTDYLVTAGYTTEV